MSSNDAILIKKTFRHLDFQVVYEVRYVGCVDNYDIENETKWGLMMIFYELEEAIKYGQQQGTEYGCIFSGL